jgi:uncharacterized membrane protein YeaQ/YmgE (transglycosylase-associated protein family)
MNLLITLLLAGLVGWLASKVMNTDAEMGWVANVIVGIIGGLLGTALLGFISPATPTDSGFNLMGILVGVIGASIAIAIWKAIAGRRLM